MAGKTEKDPPNPVDDPYGYLGITLNPDGSITRGDPFFPSVPPNPDPHSSPPPRAVSKDIPFGAPQNQTWARVFLPRQALLANRDKKLQIVVYFHGGGFVLLSAATNIYHDFCANMAAELSAVVVSVEYRLTPEHRLPAAYEDAVEALQAVRTSDEEWLTTFADYSSCFLMGTSAGGNIAYRLGLRAAGDVEGIQPLIIRGVIMNQPFFGGVQRTASELRMVNDPVLPPVICDIMWGLSLPLGVDQDHEYSNPAAGGGPEALERIGAVGWRALVSGCEGDPLIDRQVAVVELMREKGVGVVGCFVEGGYHGVEILDLSKAMAFFSVVKDFLASF